MKFDKFIIIGITAFLFLLIAVPWYEGRLAAGLLLIAFLPGYALLTMLWPSSDNQPLAVAEQCLIAVAVSYGLTITLLLLMVFAKLPLNILSVSGSLIGLTLIFVLIGWWQKTRTPYPLLHQERRQGVRWLIIILLIAALFRMVQLYYSDLQGDEADILLRAVSLTYGQIEAMLTHSKGPGEILLLNAIGAITGQFDEQTARLPFSLAGTASVGLIMLLGIRFFNPAVGIIAGLLAALDGTLISYARTAQYQSVVLLLTLATILCYYHFQQTGGQSRRWHGLGTFLLAAAFLFHFEMVLLLPVVLYLTFKNGEGYGSRLKQLWLSAIIFGFMTASFYIPFLLNPNVQATGNYLENRIGGGSSPPFNNLSHFFYFEALKYNSAYYVILVNLLLVAVVVATLMIAFPLRKEGKITFSKDTMFKPHRFLKPVRFIPKWLCLGLGLALLGQSRLSNSVVAIGLAGFFILAILSPQVKLPQKILWLWIAPPLWVYVFLVNRPGKHHYLFMAALLIFVAVAVAEAWAWVVSRWHSLNKPLGKIVVSGLSVMLLLIFSLHAVMLFLQSDLEYILTYPSHKSSFYPTDAAYPYNTRIGFGYPFRLGWQVIGQLKRTGQLEGSWGGNDKGNSPNWYMEGLLPTPCYPHYVFHGEITYKGDDKFDVPFEPSNFGYVPRYRIWGNGRLQMTVLEFAPDAPSAPPTDLFETTHFEPAVTAADFVKAMSASSASPQIPLQPTMRLGEGTELKNNAPPEYLERAKNLKGQIALLGYDLDKRYAHAGSILPLTLYWQVQTSLNLRYKIFVHLVSADGKLWAQSDDFPACGTSQANAWPPNAITSDSHLLKLSPDIPNGTYTLQVGMYEPDLNLRLNALDIAGNEQGNSLTLAELEIKN